MTPILLSVDRQSAAATNEDLDTSRVPEGEAWRLDHVSGEDETTAFTSIRAGIVRGGVFYPLEEQITVAAGELSFTGAPILLSPTDQLRLRFVGTTSGDKLHLRANGYRWTTNPGPWPMMWPGESAPPFPRREGG